MEESAFVVILAVTTLGWPCILLSTPLHPASGRAGLLVHLCTASSEQSPGPLLACPAQLQPLSVTWSSTTVLDTTFSAPLMEVSGYEIRVEKAVEK